MSLDVAIEKLNMDRTIQSPGEATDGEGAERVLPQREDQGDSEGTRTRREESEFDELKKKIEAAGMPKDVLEKSMQELKKLEAMPPMSAESTVIAELPRLAAGCAVEEALEGDPVDRACRSRSSMSDHYGLEKIKDRILGVSGGSSVGKESRRGRFSASSDLRAWVRLRSVMSIAKATGRRVRPNVAWWCEGRG